MMEHKLYVNAVKRQCLVCQPIRKYVWWAFEISLNAAAVVILLVCVVNT